VSATPASFEAALLSLDLPEPVGDDLNEAEFLNHVNQVWSICERFDLQTEIWRGRILRCIRDREKHQGQGQSGGFLQWLREQDISKSHAYGLIQLADSADGLVREGNLDPTCVNNFSKQAFLATAKAAPAVQQLISAAANGGQQINRHQVKRLHDEFTSVTSDLLPEEVRQRTQDQLLPAKTVAPLVKELSRLPREQQEQLRRELAAAPELDTVKATTQIARSLAKAQDAALALQTVQNHQQELDLDKALQEAQDLELLGVMAEMLRHAQQVEQSAKRLHQSWQRLGQLHECVWLEGSSTSHLCRLLETLDSLSGRPVQVPLSTSSSQGCLQLEITSSGD